MGRSPKPLTLFASIVVLFALRKAQLEQTGLYICRDGQPQLLVNDELRGGERLFVRFLKIAHGWANHPRFELVGWRFVSDSS